MAEYVDDPPAPEESDDGLGLPEEWEGKDWDNAMKLLAREAVNNARFQNAVMKWRMENESRYLPSLLGGAHQFMTQEANRPETMFVSPMFQPQHTNRQRTSFDPLSDFVSFEAPEILDPEGKGPPPPPPLPVGPWVPPPGYMVGPVMKSPPTVDDERDFTFDADAWKSVGQLPPQKTDDERDISALMMGTQGQLPYGVTSTDDERDFIFDADAWRSVGQLPPQKTDEDRDIAALMMGTQGQLPYGATSTDNELDIAALMMGTQGQLPYGATSTDNDVDLAALMAGTQGQLPYGATSTDNELDLAALMGATQGQLPYGAVATEEPIDPQAMMMGTQGALPYLNRPEQEMTFDADLWRNMDPSTFSRENTYDRSPLSERDAALAAYELLERPDTSVYAREAAFDPRDAFAAYGQMERDAAPPPSLSAYEREATMGPGMAAEAYTLPNMQMGAVAGGGSAGGAGAGGGGGAGNQERVSPVEGIERFVNENPQLMGQANLIPASLRDYITTNTGVDARGMTAVQFDDWMNGRDVIVQGEVIPSNPRIVDAIRKSEGAENFLAVLSTWAERHREDEFQRRGGTVGFQGQAGGFPKIDLGILSGYVTGEALPPITQADIDEANVSSEPIRKIK